MRVLVSCTSCFKRFKFKFKRFTINTTPKTPVADWTLACIRMHLHYQLDGSSMTPRPPVLQGPKYYRTDTCNDFCSFFRDRTKLHSPDAHTRPYLCLLLACRRVAMADRGSSDLRNLTWLPNKVFILGPGPVEPLMNADACFTALTVSGYSSRCWAMPHLTTRTLSKRAWMLTAARRRMPPPATSRLCSELPSPVQPPYLPPHQYWRLCEAQGGVVARSCSTRRVTLGHAP